MDLLNSEPVVSLSGDEFLPIEGKTFTQQVQEFFSAQGGKASSPFGIVLLDKRGIKNDLGHGIGRLKAASFAAVKDVLEKGVVINPMGQYHTNNKKNPTGMIAAPITIGGEKYVCVVEVIANRQVTRLYVHEVTLTKNLQGDVADSNAVPEDNSLVTQPQGEIAKVLRNYVNTKNNGENNTKTENRHMNKKQIRLTESDLKQIVKESVSKILSEAYGTPRKWDKETFGSLATPSYEEWNPSQSTLRKDYYNGNRPFEGVMKVGELINDLYGAIRDITWKDEDYLNDAGMKTTRTFAGDRGRNTIFKYQDLLTKKLDEMNHIHKLLLNKLKQTTGEQPYSRYDYSNPSNQLRMRNS